MVQKPTLFKGVNICMLVATALPLLPYVASAFNMRTRSLSGSVLNIYIISFIPHYHTVKEE